MATKITKATVQRARPQAKAYEVWGQLRLVLRVQPSGVKTWYVQTARHKRIRIGDAEVITLARAEYRAREILNEVHDYGGALKVDLNKSTLRGFIEGVYAPWVRANRRRAEKTLLDLERCFEGMLPKRITAIAASDLDAYVAARRAAGSSAATIVRNLNSLRGVLRLAVERGYLRENVFRGWRKPKVEDNGVTRYLSAEEAQRLRTVLKQRDDEARKERTSANKWRAERGQDPLPEIPKRGFSDHLTPMVLVSVSTGLRYGELSALEWSSVDFRANDLTVTARTAKGAKTRHIPLSRECSDVLKRWRAQTEGQALVFANPNGSRIGSVKTAWLGVLTKAKIENFRWHDLRHTFASWLVQSGENMAKVRGWLGHGDFALTLRYAHLDPRQSTAAIERLAL